VPITIEVIQLRVYPSEHLTESGIGNDQLRGGGLPRQKWSHSTRKCQDSQFDISKI